MSKSKLIIIIGMPGSGKTTLLEKLKRNSVITEFYDDYQGHADNHQKDPRLSNFYTPLLARLKKGETVAVSDIRYCVNEELNKFIQAILEVAPETLLEYQYFENNPAKCKENVKRRGRKDRIDLELNFIDEHSPNYAVTSVTTLKIPSDQVI